MSVSTLEPVPFRRSPPGIVGYAPEVVGAIMLRWQQLQIQRVPTVGWVRHTLEDGSPRFLNRLILREDPSERQHAHDPVDWRPFAPDAFDEARRSARPVLLWVRDPDCPVARGVWERVFSDLHIARSANRAYVPVLLTPGGSADDVERYRAACELLGASRSRSAVLWLTPGRAPYAAWTSDDEGWRRGGAMGSLLALLEAHSELPKQASIERCSSGSRAGCGGLSGVFVGVDRERLEVILSGAADALSRHWRMYLGQRGERGSVPVDLLRFALRHGERQQRPELLRWAQDRLEERIRGAGRDHLGGGHYAGWQGPGRLPGSFDKELDDNAELALAFLEAWELSGRRDMFWASDEILGVAWAELRSEFGAFHAALRRPSEARAAAREVGFTMEEIRQILGDGLFEVVRPSLGLHPLGDGKLLVTLPPLSDSTEQGGVRRSHVERARAALAEARRRVDAGRSDQRVLPGANGSMIAALARTARSLDHIGPDARTWLDTAALAAESTTRLLWHRGRLHEAFMHGVRQPGQASFRDHVQLALGFLELFESTGRVHWLRMCLALEDALRGLWTGQPQGVERRSLARLHRRIDERERGRDAAAWALLLARLSTLLSDPQRRTRAMALLRPWFSRLEIDPMGYASLLASAERVLADPQVLLVWSHDDTARRAAFLSVLRGVGSPGREVVVTGEGCDLDELPSRLPIAAHHRSGAERAATYVCGTRSCSRGLETPYALQRFLLSGRRPTGGPQAA